MISGPIFVPKCEETEMEGRNVNILGGAQTDFARNWTKEGKGFRALLREVIEDALTSVHMDYEDINELNHEGRVACFIGNFIAEKYIEQGHLGALLTEIDPCFWGVPSARYEAACASGSVALNTARSHIALGDYDIALVIGWELMKTVDARTGGSYLGYAALNELEARGIEFPFPKLFGRLADAMLAKYGVDESRMMNSMARIAEINYTNAARNPRAQTRNWFMNLRQAMDRGSETNPFIGGCLASSDCSQVTDGASAVILVSDSYLAERGLGECPRIKGWGHRVAPMLFSKKIEDANSSDHVLPWSRQAVNDALGRAGISLSDIGIIETHDCFTSSEYASISAFGITEPGYEWKAVEEGIISFDGALPINPSGGLIGCGHPVGASGVRMVLDCYKQVTRTAGSYQVLHPVDNAITLNFGGSATTTYSFVIGW